MTKDDLRGLWRRVADRPAIEPVGFDGWLARVDHLTAKAALIEDIAPSVIWVDGWVVGKARVHAYRSK